MPVRTGVPRTTHKWLGPLYDALDDVLGYTVPSGASGIANGAWLGRGVAITQVGNATGVVGFYGATGIAPISAASGLLSMTYLGASGFGFTFISPSGQGLSSSGLAHFLARAAWNGGSGTIYTVNDVVLQLKNMGILPA
jgi:hypothetical protein